MSTPVVDVAVCVVQSPHGQVLLAERTSRQVAAGYWELPGGKIEPGESPTQAAARELEEETGLSAVGVTPWLSYEHQFRTKRLRLHFCRTRGWQGSPHGREGQRLAWVDPRAPHVGPVLPSNDRALFALSAPSAYIVADLGLCSSPDAFLDGIHDALSRGESLLRIRLPSTSPGQAASVLARVAGLAARFPAARLFAPTIMDARRAGFAGVHSCNTALRRLTARPPSLLWAATCHDEIDLEHAISLGADFVVLSPIRADPERSWRTAIGWDGLRRHAGSAAVPIYADGGLTQNDVQAVRQTGAAGLVLSCAEACQPSKRHFSAGLRQHAHMQT